MQLDLTEQELGTVMTALDTYLRHNGLNAMNQCAPIARKIAAAIQEYKEDRPRPAPGKRARKKPTTEKTTSDK